jgi:hypothetical protein
MTRLYPNCGIARGSGTADGREEPLSRGELMTKQDMTERELYLAACEITGTAPRSGPS